MIPGLEGNRRWVSLRGDAITAGLSDEFAGVGLIKVRDIGLETGCAPFVEPRISLIERYLRTVATSFEGKPVWYRFSCHSSAKMNDLRGTRHILRETSPFLGRTGVRRLLHYSDELSPEASMLQRVYTDHPNVGAIAPFIHAPDQYQVLLRTLQNIGYRGELGIMLEIPSALLLFEGFLQLGCRQFVVGLNDLTSLTLGVARYEPSVKSLFDRSHPAIVKLVDSVVKRSYGTGARVGIAGYLTDNDVATYSQLDVSFVSLYLSNSDIS